MNTENSMVHQSCKAYLNLSIRGRDAHLFHEPNRDKWKDLIPFHLNFDLGIWLVDEVIGILS